MIKRWFYLIAILSATWCIGFVIFLYTVSSLPKQNELSEADVIIVLTGDEGRIQAATELFDKGYSRKMLVTGCGKGVSKTALKSLTNSKEYPQRANDITLGYIATNTVSNALEANIFMTLHNFNSMILVTSDYHMPRSYYLMKNKMPALTIIPYSVPSNKVLSLDYITLSVLEYSKYLVVLGWELMGTLAEGVFYLLDQISAAI
jgi:uncharacterized SAM-binding protein YcdF (DUF218 family)